MIKGSKITLRAVRETDLETLFALSSDISNRGEYFPHDFHSETSFKKDFQENGLWTGTGGQLLICDKDEQIVGTVFVYGVQSYFNGPEIGYILFNEGSRNKGYVTEAVSLVVKYLFSNTPINRIQIVVDPLNLASKRVAQKCGFKFEGIARGAFFHNGRNRDVEVHSILHDEAALAKE
jgi:[ribosomal protein S5]-alanine N-acetyltransferase